MKKIALFLAAAAALIGSSCSRVSSVAEATPDHIDSLRVQGDNSHVQGIAYDKTERCFYCSFTSSFYKVGEDGEILASIDSIHGHLGAMSYDAKAGKVYASLECKDDEIGRGIAAGLGDEAYTKDETHFYLAEIDVKAMKMDLHELEEVRKDYLEGNYGCSGIDGVTVAPEFKKGRISRKRLVYVAYGIYGDTTRVDNDYNILLAFKPGHFDKPVKKIFIHTGNTTYGVQNLAYDAFDHQMYMAVYRGWKPQYPNYKLFATNIEQEPYKAVLDGVDYDTAEHWQVDVSSGSRFNWGSTGFCPLGDGYVYISQNASENGRQYTDIKLYKHTGDPSDPFTRP